MDPIYYFIIGLILVLSCFDLVVGVSNDAANFLNSAVGSKAAPRRTIVLVAALGIIIGSLFSSIVCVLLYRWMKSQNKPTGNKD